MRLLIIFVAIITFSMTSKAQDKNAGSGKVQKVDFAGSDVDGKVRSPDGSYLVQKKGVDFEPLYKVKKKFNDNVKESLEYVH